MKQETYTPGHSQNATDFMAQRSFASHGRFFAPYLEPSHSVLDAGCGPGSMTLGIAQAVSLGHVHGIDFGPAQIESAKTQARRAGIVNAFFTTASCYALPFGEATFDRVFCHALMEHLSRPLAALSEFARVLKPGGLVGLCSPDFDGLLVVPPSPEVSQAIEAYAALQHSNGGDLRVGKKLAGYLAEAGFVKVATSARYECYPSLDFIGEYLAQQLDKALQHDHAGCLRMWSQSPVGMFAQAWVSVVGTKREACHE